SRSRPSSRCARLTIRPSERLAAAGRDNLRGGVNSEGSSATSTAANSLAESQRGHLRVFLGMAAGVGKTYSMLLEGHAASKAGRDVVIGLLETHGRQDTAQLADRLPIVPRRRVEYRGTEL